VRELDPARAESARAPFRFGHTPSDPLVFLLHEQLRLAAQSGKSARLAQRLAEGNGDLTGLALELGFSSHSHLTDAFRHAFGVPPSEYRKSCDGRRLRELSRNLEVPALAES